jgi:hypothetical protein
MRISISSRQEGDAEDLRGGVREVVPARQSYYRIGFETS